MLWIKALHIIFMVTWFAGLFYLPRLFVYHAMTQDHMSIERFKVMERKLYYGIMMPGAFFTIFFGLWMIYLYPVYLIAPWMHAKLLLVFLTIVYHFYLGHVLKAFKANKNTKSHKYYRVINEIPVLFLAGIVILAVVHPF